jgi:hypothetical protein
MPTTKNRSHHPVISDRFAGALDELLVFVADWTAKHGPHTYKQLRGNGGLLDLVCGCRLVERVWFEVEGRTDDDHSIERDASCASGKPA